MKFDDLAKNYNGDIVIKGRNIGEEKGNFMLPSQRWNNESLEIISSLKKLEELYLKSYNYLEKNNDEVTPMVVKDGKVIIDDTMFYHRSISEMDVLRSMSITGVIATEWFGILESEMEGRFCTFVNKPLNEEEISKQLFYYVREKNILASYYQSVIYFDCKHPLMQELLKYDFFEYAYLKRHNSELINSRFPKDIIDIFENLVYPMSPSGLEMHEKESSNTYYWKAIPSGIPPQLINGISIHSEKENVLNHLEELCELFPNATIFDEQCNVLGYGKNIRNEMKVR